MQPGIYLFFPGNCREAMTHYAEVLGGEITHVMTNGEAPKEDQMPGAGDDAVMNMGMMVGGVNIMGSDNTPDWYSKPQGFMVSLPMESRAEFDRVWDALAKDAEQVTMAPDKTFWAERFGMFTDKYGTPFMLNLEA